MGGRGWGSRRPPGHHISIPQISEVLLQSLQPFGGNAGEGSRATPSTKSPRCHLWLCPSRAQRRGREEGRTAFQETPASPATLTSDRPLRSSVSWPLSTFFSLSMSGPRPPPLGFARPTALPGAQPPPLRPLPTTARPAQAPAHLPARHAPRQPRPLSEPLGVTWGWAGRVGVKSARRFLTRKLAPRWTSRIRSSAQHHHVPGPGRTQAFRRLTRGC